MPQRVGGGSAPLTLNLLPAYKSARGLPNLARISRTGCPDSCLSLGLHRTNLPRFLYDPFRKYLCLYTRHVMPLLLLSSTAYFNCKFLFISFLSYGKRIGKNWEKYLIYFTRNGMSYNLIIFFVQHQ